MNIDIETVKFIGMLNHLAYLTGICKEPIPFGEKSPEIIEMCKNDPNYKNNIIFYDENSDTRPMMPCMGPPVYSIVRDFIVDEDHDDIISYYDDFVLVYIGDDDWYIYLAVNDKEGKTTEIIIENGEWYILE